MTKKQKAKDNRLQRTYNVTLKERTRQERKQKRRCIICNKRIEECASKVGLHVDHAHWVSAVKVKCVKLREYWKAYNVGCTRYGIHLPEAMFKFKSRNKRKAKKNVTQKLKRIANRGLLCWPCNSALRRFHDDPVKMQRAAIYIKLYMDKLKKLLQKKGSYDLCW